MKRKWTQATASQYLTTAIKRGLKWCSAFDYLKNHTSVNVLTLISKEVE